MKVVASNNRRPPLRWGRAPLLLPVLAFAGGIAVAATLRYAHPHIFAGGGLIALFCALALHLRARHRLPLRRAATVALLAVCTALGGYYATARHPPNRADHFAALPAGTLLARATSVRPGERHLTVELRATAVVHADTLRSAHGRLLVYLPPDERTAALRPGRRLALRVTPEPIPGPQNPAGFNYARYLATQNVFHRAFVRDSADWQLLPGSSPSLTAIAERWRRGWFASLQPYLSGDNLAVAAALIMGKRDLLGTEIKSAYADTGAIHVLAVSGLHVGILALLVTQLLRLLLPARPLWRILRTVLTVTAVWAFALVTGLSPSVQRAAMMVTVVLLGLALRRRNGIFNLLAIAALVMLLAEPKQLFRVGFQLSFLAVVGIAVFARPLDRLLYVPWRPLRAAWRAVGVSTAAQLGTLPLALLYFRQFPVYFMLSGTLVVVFAYLVLALGLLHGLLAALGLGEAWLWPTGTLLNTVVDLQNAFIYYCRALPGSTLRLADFGWPSALGLAALLGLLAYLAYRPSHRARWATLLVAGGLFFAWLIAPPLRPPRPQLTIYHANRATVVDVCDGRRIHALGDSTDVTYTAQPLRDSLGLRAGPAYPLNGADTLLGDAVVLRYPLLRLLDRTILVVDGRERRSVLPTDLAEPDLILVVHDPDPDLLADYRGDATFVLDGSTPRYRLASWRRPDRRVYSTADSGAYRYFPPSVQFPTGH